MIKIFTFGFQTVQIQMLSKKTISTIQETFIVGRMIILKKFYIDLPF